MMSLTLLPGDCMDVLKTLDADSIHACLTDPPYHLTNNTGTRSPYPGQYTPIGKPKEPKGGFMGAKWDGGDIAFRPELWAEVLRVLKPGGYLAAFSGTRTQHRMVCAIEDAGFEIRDNLSYLHDGGLSGPLLWTYGSGFPKSRNVSRDLLTLPWCSCAVSEVAGARAEGSIPAHERRSAFSADAGISSDGSSRCGTTDVDVNASAPLSGVSTSNRAKLVACPPDGTLTDQTGRLRNKLRGRSGHRRSTVAGGIKDLIGHSDPKVLGAAGMTVLAASDEVVQLVGSVQRQPEPLRNQVVSEDVVTSPAVLTNPAIPFDSSNGDVFPSASLIGPTPASPCGVPPGTKAIPVRDGHASARAINRVGIAYRHEPPEDAAAACTIKGGRSSAELTASASLEQNGLYSGRTGATAKLGAAQSSHELNGAVLTGFDRHEDIIRSLITEGKVSVCVVCGRPHRPAWIVDGMGTALKPAVELICLARKPISEPTVAANFLKHGTGALNIDGCRIEGAMDGVWGSSNKTVNRDRKFNSSPEMGDYRSAANAAGRWPANLAHDGSDEVLAAFPSVTSGNLEPHHTLRASENGSMSGKNYERNPRQFFGGDTGSAARFFYTAKADKADRADSLHPTVKPVDLIRHYLRLITPPGGTVIDCFAGSGTTGEAAMLEGFDCILIERDADSVRDINHRCKRWSGADMPLFTDVS